jgi:uncharacterized protein YndB with AHSA1/START domain
MKIHSGLRSHSLSKRRSSDRLGLGQNSTGDLRSLSMEVSIRADARRLFYALTDPEYLEVWICIPGHQSGCSTAAVRNDRDYAIEHLCHGRRSVSITGNYRVCQRRNVEFTWRVEGDVCVPETQVDVRLRGDFDRTILTLRHSGFACSFDFSWHRSLWDLSIARLVALYGTPASQQSFGQRAKEARGRSGHALLD